MQVTRRKKFLCLLRHELGVRSAQDSLISTSCIHSWIMPELAQTLGLISSQLDTIVLLTDVAVERR